LKVPVMSIWRLPSIINDFKNTVIAHWFKEMINFNQKTVAVTLLMFITIISPTLTFGAVYGKSTNNEIGAM
jgi:HCO3- transporter family